MNSATQKRDSRVPEWLLDEEWGIGRDSLNWILLRRKRDSKNWRPRAYFPTLRPLLECWCRRYSRTSPVIEVLYEHIDAAAEHCAKSIDRLTSRIGAQE